MKEHTSSYRQTKLTALFIVLLVGFFKSYAQCPTVTTPTQTFCDIESLLVSDLVATDNGNGVVWYDMATSTTPLPNSFGIVNGEDYYADDNSGTCGVRQRVDVIIFGPPTGFNFQGVCVENASDATIADLVATGNDVQWYSTSTGGTALASTDILNDGTIYYADQENPTTGCRTSRLSVLVNVGLVPTPSGSAIQEFCNFPDTPPTVADLNASGVNNWYDNISSALPLDPSTLLVDGATYYSTTLDPPCESTGRFAVTVVFFEPNDAGEDGTLDLCITDMPQDLFFSLGGTPDAGGTWSPLLTSGSGIFDPNNDAPGVYTYTVSDTDPCGDVSATVTVTVGNEVGAGDDGTLDICENDAPQDLFSSLGGSPDTGGTWSPLLTSGTGIFDPSLDPAGVYTYTVLGGACGDETATVTVTVSQEPNAGLDGTLDLCSNDGPQDLFNSLGGTPDSGGTWSPTLTSGTGVFDPLIDAANVYTYTVVNSCNTETATVTVTVAQESNAGTNGTLELCSNSAAEDLFNSLGGTPDIGGTWSPALASGTGIFNPLIDTAGIYTYTIVSTPPCGNASATVTVSVTQEPDAGTNGNLDICNNDTPQDLFNSLGGTPDTGGTWSPTLTSGTGVFDPLLDTTGTYTYTVIGTPPCMDATATVTVAVIPIANAGTNGTLELCSNSASEDLFNSLGGTPDIGGTWSPALASSTGIFNPLIDIAGIYTYTIIGTPPCGNVSATVTVSVTQEPNAGTSGTLDICNNDTPQDLFNSLGGTPDTGGTWSPALSSGTGVFDPLLDTTGTYTYTVIGTPPCMDATATVTVAVIPIANAGINGTLELCSNSASEDLFNSLGGTPDIGGTWSPALASGTGIFNPLIDIAGIYTYTIIGTPPCGNVSATVTVSVTQEPNAGTSGTLDICNNDTPQDLFNSLGGTPDTGGTWSPALASGTGVFDPLIDVASVYTYTVTGTPPCMDASATVTVSVSTVVDAGTDGILDLCSDSGPEDLFNSLGGVPDLGGTWSPALASGTGIFDPLVDAAGMYTYTVIGSPPCSNDSATVTVVITQAPDAGIDGTLDICTNDSPQDLFNSLGGTPDPGGTWFPELASGTGVFDPLVDPAGVYFYSVFGDPPCDGPFLRNTNSTSSVTVTVSNSPNAGTNGALDICETDTSQDLFNSLGGMPDLGGSWSPALASGTGVFDPLIDTSGIYTYTVTNACGSASAEVNVTLNNIPNAGGDVTLVLCNTDGPINLFIFLSGSPDPGGSWSPALVSGTGVFTPGVDPEGIYTYTVTNGACGSDSASIDVTVTEPSDAGEDASINLCENDDPVDLFGVLGGSPDSGGVWSPVLASGTGVFNPAIDAPGVYEYSVGGGITSTCNAETALVTVGVSQLPDAGLNGTLDICTNDMSQDLYNSLGGTPDSGGSWSPALSSGTGIFDPLVDTAGVYTYIVTGTPPCMDASATVTVTLNTSANAGINGTLDLCSNSAPEDLFNSLGGTPETGGTWSPTLASSSGIFDPLTDAAGVYTYTVSNALCGNTSATVTVSISQEPNAGTDGILDICTNDTAQDLYNSLGGTPDLGGTWSPSLTSGSGIFDPNVDLAGVYTYTVIGTAPCANATATVTVTISPLADAGTNGTLDLCINSTPEDLFNSLNGTPQAGGIWSPALTSGSGVFDPTTDTSGDYTYTVTNACGSDSSIVTVTITDIPDVSGARPFIDSICLGDSAQVFINDAFSLVDGDYLISFDLTGANTLQDIVLVTFTGGIGNFTILDTDLINAGINTFTVIEFTSANGVCNADISALSSVQFSVEEASIPTLIMDGDLFCNDANATILDLTNNIVETDAITWYDMPTGGTAYSDDTILVNGETYYASLTTSIGCMSEIRLAVTVEFEECGLVIPDGFSPNGDGTNDDFHIINLRELYPNFKLTIYNRHGNTVYQGDKNTPNWNGISDKSSFGNSEVPVGVYFYILEFNDGSRKPKQGRIYLNR